MRSKIKKIGIIGSIAIILIILTSLFILHINKEEVAKINVTNNVEKLAIEENVQYANLEKEIADSTNCQYDTIDNGNIIITEYYGNKESVIIPEEINGIKVEKISKNAFLISENLELIEMPIDIFENNCEIDGFEKDEELSDEEKIIFKTTNEYTDSFLWYRNLSDEEKKTVTVIPRKFKETRKDIEQETTLTKFNANSHDASATLPTSFDLRNQIQISAGNQGELGICYAYAINKSIETNIALKYGERVDLSEIDLAMRSKQLYGGTLLTANYEYFRPGIGPIREKAGTLLSQSYVDNYRSSDIYANAIWNACVKFRSDKTFTSTEEQAVQRLASAGGDPEYYVMCYTMFESIDGNLKRTNLDKVEKNRNKLKEYIINYGSAYTFVMMDSSRYTKYNGKMVMNCTGSETKGAHAVSIIGWDDNFSRYNFPSNLGVTQDGAWLVLNSWGNTWGNGDGTFWISYQDAFVETDNFAISDISKGKFDISNANKVDIGVASEEYNASPKTPQISAYYKSEENVNYHLFKDEDYTVTYSNNINAGTGTATITGKGRFKGTTTKTFTITPRHINTVTVTLETESYTYDGTAKEPSVTVKDGNKTLTINKDYTITYSDNTNAGTPKATVTVTGIGNYTGAIMKTFTITPKNIELATATLGTPYIYRGTAVTPAVTVKDGDKTLTIFKDYTITHSNNTNVGTATVTIKGRGNYIGTITKTFEIVPKSINNVTVILEAKSYTYDGIAKEPSVTVKDEDKTLTINKDYTITYSNNTNVGTATVTIIGKGNYTGSARTTFTIIAKNINTATVTLAPTTYTYDGTSKIPAATVKDGNTTLIKDTDYTVTYSNNTNVGTATILITGKGNYTGTVTKTFGITAKNINTATVELEATTYTYDGTAKIPAVTVKEGNATLTKDTDYTITYSNNTNVGTATVTITGIGNYTGEEEISFEIQKGEYPYTIPSGLTAIYNSALRDIKLPKGFNWEDDLDTKVGEAGYNTFKCTYTPEDTINYNIVTGIEVIIEVKEKLKVDIEEYKTEFGEDNKITYLKGIEIGKNLEDIGSKINTNGIVEIFEKNGTKVTDKNKISKTGMKLKITKEKESVEYIIVVVGDNNGDGKITITDVVRANLYLTHIKNLQGEFAKAVDINNDGRVTITDIVKVKLKSVHM